jgi:hypothetical protein
MKYEFANQTVLNKITGKPMKYRDLQHTPEAPRWRHADHAEWIRLGDETNTTRFIREDDKPIDRKASYYNPQPEIKIKEGEEVYRIRGTYGGNQGDPYPGDKSAYVADLVTLKLLLNCVVSTPKAKFMTMDIKDFYLGTPLKVKQYMRVHRKYIPDETIVHYNLQDPSLWKNDHILVEISKGIYGLPEAGKLAQDMLYEYLSKHGYKLAESTPGLLTHETKDIKFTLVVDDFGVYYTNQQDVEELIRLLQDKYTIGRLEWYQILGDED